MTLSRDEIALRDHFAMNSDGLREDADAKYASMILGRPAPTVEYAESREALLEWRRFFAEADAVVRYIYADAMLKARAESTRTQGGEAKADRASVLESALREIVRDYEFVSRDGSTVDRTDAYYETACAALGEGGKS